MNLASYSNTISKLALQLPIFLAIPLPITQSHNLVLLQLCSHSLDDENCIDLSPSIPCPHLVDSPMHVVAPIPSSPKVDSPIHDSLELIRITFGIWSPPILNECTCWVFYIKYKANG